MGPPFKRARLFEPENHALGIVYNSDNCSSSYEDDSAGLEVEEDEQGATCDKNSGPGNPDAQLEQTRAQADLKLKSRFEAIFEKYDRDFTGIGDEIDLRTGEIVINNGHLLEMEDERDDGTWKPDEPDEPDESFDSTEADDAEHDDFHEYHIETADMEEDDMILFQKPKAKSDKPRTAISRSGLFRGLQSDKQEDKGKDAAAKVSHNLDAEIISQFGQDFSPKIARYVSQERIQDGSAVEPAWRTPGLPLATPGKRPILKSILLQSDNDRSPSPNGSSSVWAPNMPRGRRRRDGADAAAVFRGETISEDSTWYSGGYMSTTVTKQHTEQMSPIQSKHTMSTPRNQMITGETSMPEPSLWAKPTRPDPSDMRGLDGNPIQEPDSFDENFVTFHHPRRSWSNPSFPSKQETSVNLRLEPDQARNQVINVPPSNGRRKRHKRDKYSNDEGRRARHEFTEADDKVLFEWMEVGLRKGLAMWSTNHWNMFAARNPQHSLQSWRMRYRRSYLQTSIDSSMGQQDLGEASSSGIGFSQAINQTGDHPQSKSRVVCSFNKHYYEMLHKLFPARPDNTPQKPSPKGNSSRDSRFEAFNLDVLDPALRPTFNQNYSFDVGGPQVGRAMHQVGSRADGHSYSSRKEDSLAHRTMGIKAKKHNVINGLRKNTPSRDESPQIMSSTDTGMATKRAQMSQGSQIQQQIPQKLSDSFYDFSDEEDEVAPMHTRSPIQLRVSDTGKKRKPSNTQIVERTLGHSSPSNNIISKLPTLKNSPKLHHQAPIYVSSSLPMDDASESGEDEFFPKPVTTHPTPEMGTPRSAIRASRVRSSMDPSPGGSTVETPGGTKRRCGEGGFKCGRGFCFKCLNE